MMVHAEDSNRILGLGDSIQFLIQTELGTQTDMHRQDWGEAITAMYDLSAPRLSYKLFPHKNALKLVE